LYDVVFPSVLCSLPLTHSSSLSLTSTPAHTKAARKKMEEEKLSSIIKYIKKNFCVAENEAQEKLVEALREARSVERGWKKSEIENCTLCVFGF
jgi:hypothetical protein